MAQGNAAAGGAEAAGGGGGQQQQQRPNMIVMLLVVFLASQYFFSRNTQQQTPGPEPSPEPLSSDVFDEPAEVPVAKPSVAPSTPPNPFMALAGGVGEPVDSPFMPYVFSDITPATVLFNLFTSNAPLHLQVYGSVSKDDFNATDLLWDVPDLVYSGDEANEREIEFNMTLPDSVIYWDENYYLHIFISEAGYPHDMADPAYEEDKSYHLCHQMTKFIKSQTKQTRSLLGGEDEGQSAEEGGAEQVTAVMEEGEAAEEEPPKAVLAWKPTAPIGMLHDFANVKPASMLPMMKTMLKIGKRNGAWGYFPMTHVNEFWLLTEDMIPLNETVTEVPLTLSIGPIGKWKLQLQSMMMSQWKQQEEWGLVEEGETDEIKRVLLETDPWLLAITAAVSTLHMVFDFLAFKNDISFWKNNKSMEGLSLRAIVTNVFFQLVITLYLLDNETSWMILLSQFVGLAIEIWKLRKAVHIKIDFQGGTPNIEWKDRESYTRSRTKEYDDIAMAHLMYALIPLSLGYAGYSLMYEQHKGWYSWVISSLTGFVYTFGFVFMTPQLFINYKKKSVAHMPWRAMVYKSLNTFIDDLFAFVIKMPMMHRISCFRDDLIFFIYLYQRWVYKVDPTRKNEFGVSQEDLEEAGKRAQLIKDGHIVSRRPKRVRIFPEAAQILRHSFRSDSIYLWCVAKYK